MWRQAFGLDKEDSRTTSLHNRGDDKTELSRGESSRTGGNTAAYHDDDPAFKSRWSSSTSSLSSVRAHRGDHLRESLGSETSSSFRLMELIPRLLMASAPSPLDKSSEYTREVSPLYASPSNSSFDQHQPLWPSPLVLPSKQVHSPRGAVRDAVEVEDVQHHRNIALRMLEGRTLVKTKDKYILAFRTMFRTQRAPVTRPILPALLAVPPLSLKSPPQCQGAICISSQEWTNLRDDILSGLTGDVEGVFPFHTENQEAMFIPIEQRENSFKVQARPQREEIPMDGVKAALERIEARNWEDVIFVAYDDTPREMRWWNTTREPRVLQWGMNMI